MNWLLLGGALFFLFLVLPLLAALFGGSYRRTQSIMKFLLFGFFVVALSFWLVGVPFFDGEFGDGFLGRIIVDGDGIVLGGDGDADDVVPLPNDSAVVVDPAPLILPLEPDLVRNDSSQVDDTSVLDDGWW